MNSTVCHIKLVLYEKAQPDSYISAQRYKEHLLFLRKFLKDFKCALWSEKYGMRY